MAQVRLRPVAHTYRVDLGAFDTKSRTWNVDLLSAANVRVLSLAQGGEPLLRHLWEHHRGSGSVRWKESQDEPPFGLEAVVELGLPRSALVAMVALGLLLFGCLVAVFYYQREVGVAVGRSTRLGGEVAACRAESKECRVQVKSEKLHSLTQELLTRGGVHYGR